jgi:hypothetical protein
MTRVRSRTGARSRTGLDMDLAAELRARLDPEAHPASAAMIRAADAERPSTLAAAFVAQAIHFGLADPDRACGRLARARSIRERTPIGGHPDRKPSATPIYLEDDDE